MKVGPRKIIQIPKNKNSKMKIPKKQIINLSHLMGSSNISNKQWAIGNGQWAMSLGEARLLLRRSDGTGGQSRIRREQLKQKTNTPRTGTINTKQ